MCVQVLEQTAQQLAGGRPKEEVIVGWGNANTGYGGCVSRQGRGPNRALLRLLVDKNAHLVVYVDEYYIQPGTQAAKALVVWDWTAGKAMSTIVTCWTQTCPAPARTLNRCVQNADGACSVTGSAACKW